MLDQCISLSVYHAGHQCNIAIDGMAITQDKFCRISQSADNDVKSNIQMFFYDIVCVCQIFFARRVSSASVKLGRTKQPYPTPSLWTC